ncbi:hypothetical protein LOY35_03715 [Pseudomonas sp. B21-028]|uniref:hypothetical protein n=1 Tax=Pseudomonas sp. B21-028 TaxID=2895480 RepID=UPI00215DD8DF|nr:hypothetical protein [Pseudomonas sp. B21-028]UVL84706.1 hypothetical protein LOY35_03715 [Pseudomonas sp. B21-028]
MSREREAEIIEVWKAVIDVQIHFNDIGMRIRGMFVTIILALFASLGFLLDKKIGLEAGRVVIQFAVVVPLFGVLGTYLFYFMDRYWYHRLLVGAVKQGVAIEKLGIGTIPELNLTKVIGDESPYEPRGFAKVFAGWIVSHPKLKTTGKLHSDGKIEFFYKSVMVALTLTALLIAYMGGVELKSSSPSTLIKTPVVESIGKVAGNGRSQAGEGKLNSLKETERAIKSNEILPAAKSNIDNSEVDKAPGVAPPSKVDAPEGHADKKSEGSP